MRVQFSARMDQLHMRAALALAARARERDASPNPRVGAVLVKDGSVVGTGFHRRAGAPHAEVEALAEAGSRARGATLYVTLEPCTHHGRTPPCAAALAEAGVSRVVAAMRDPNPRVSGGGLAWLAARGVETALGCLEEEARQLNPFFLAWATGPRPYVTLKFAMSLDGRLTCDSGAAKWISGPESRAEVHRERARHDGILAGIGTVLADDPLMTVRVPDEPPWAPLRIVLDGDARTPPNAAMLRDGMGRPLIVVGPEAPEARRRSLEAAGAEVIAVARDGRGGLALPEILRILHDRPITSLLVEGGATIHRSFLEQRLFDRILAFVAPMVLGGRRACHPAPPRGSSGGSTLRSLRGFGPDVALEVEAGSAGDDA